MRAQQSQCACCHASKGAVLHALSTLSRALNPSAGGCQGGWGEQEGAGRDKSAGVAAAGGSGPGEAIVVAGRNEGSPAAVGALGVVLGAVERGGEGRRGGGGRCRGRCVTRSHALRRCSRMTMLTPCSHHAHTMLTTNSHAAHLPAVSVSTHSFCTLLLLNAYPFTPLLLHDLTPPSPPLTAVPGARDHLFRLAGPPLLAAALPVAPFTSGSLTRLAAAATAVRAASEGNEGVKEALMDVALHGNLLHAISAIVHSKQSADRDSSVADVAEAESAICACCGAVRALVTNDNVRVAASKTFSNARAMADAGAVDVLLGAAAAFSSDMAVLPAVLGALKAIAVNVRAVPLTHSLVPPTILAREDICRSIAPLGGVPLVLAHLRAALASHCSLLAAPSAALLAQLGAGAGGCWRRRCYGSC
ncbi:unnamed protein product [Closterium sp. NIES-65]|nr:unnamed protein product [Closterium sp. NIES-65]